jgi:hypothetical protein
MRPEQTCPRCGGPIRAPGLWSSEWICEWHGAVAPFAVFPRIAPEHLHQVAETARVPLWVPLPPPTGWVVSGVASAGDERSGARATVLAMSGPAPLGGGADVVLVAEEPGVGLGARYAGLEGPDPGAGFDADAPHAKVEAAGHPTALWSIASDGCAAFVGEGKGLWLWVVLWPPEAGILLLEHLEFADVRERRILADDLPYGAVSPRLTPPTPPR